MTPKEYYYYKFKKDFESFWSKVPHRPDYVTGEPLFKFAGLVKGKKFDALEDVAGENLTYFLSTLGCTILIDQVMYSHFKEDYSEFQKVTLYPKMQVGWVNANPWMVFHQNVRLSRNLRKGEVIEKFSEFVEFFVGDLKDFFEKNKFPKANWISVKVAILNDPDVITGEFGEIFKNKLDKV